jgi:hypothetical protein
MNKEDKIRRNELVSHYPITWIRKNIYKCEDLTILEQIGNPIRIANHYGNKIELNIGQEYFLYTITNILAFLEWASAHCIQEGYTNSIEWQQDIYHAMHIPLPLHLQGCYFKNEKVN